MELVSAAKMRKAQLAAQASRPYATLSAELLQNIAARTGQINHPLMRQVVNGKPSDRFRALAIVITSDKGLAGSLNTNIINKTIELVKIVRNEFRVFKSGNDELDRVHTAVGVTEFITIGKKATEAIRRFKDAKIIATFPGKDKVITSADSKPIAEIAMKEFAAAVYEKVFVIYPQFISTLVQKPNILQLLPFESAERRGVRDEGREFLFEPSPGEVLENLITRAVEFSIYQTLAEAAASEHSARMVAMRNANEAAGELIDDLSLSYNQARQGGITRELSEISAAKLAMEG